MRPTLGPAVRARLRATVGSTIRPVVARSFVALVVVSLLPACEAADRLPTATAPRPDLVSGAAPANVIGGTAELSVNAAATPLLTGDAMWSLEKTGALSGTTVTWNITATQTATVSGQLLIQGQMAVTNTGNGPATIGNLVVNLQKRQGNSWVTQSSDIADATQGDAATTADIHKAASSENLTTFSENGASGSLNFMDASNNTVFSLVPQVLIGAGETRTLLFSAAFDNNNAALNLAPGTPIRAEVIVTFGNATQSGNSTANVDINGNGTLDADEARVRSVPSRLTVTVPAPVNGNGTVTLSDTPADITTTGDVTFSNLNINLGATTGTVTATISGGAGGGTIKNCAHLTGADVTANSGGFTFPLVDGVNLEDCDVVDVGGTPPTCTVPGAPGCGWHVGDVVTYTQGAYGAAPSNNVAAALLANQYGNVYGSIFEVGLPGSSGNSMVFTSPGALLAYLPASVGGPAALNQDLLNPTDSPSGPFGGEVAALKLNVDFNDNDLTGGNPVVSFGDLRLCGLAVSGLNNQTVRQFLATANTALGGGSTGFAISDLATVAASLNSSFAGGSVGSGATNLVNASTCVN